jgi:hypothetical protein
MEVIRATTKTIPIALKAYINASIPLIALLELKKKEKVSWHAVVISGYRRDEKRKVKELYVHDDQIGPYSSVKPVKGNFEFWDYKLSHGKAKFKIVFYTMHAI